MAGIAGRKAKAYKGTVGTLIDTAATELTDGAVYFIKAKASTSSGLPADIPVGYAFIANGTVTIAEGDEVYPLTYADDFFCILKDKSTSASKGTYDSTTDCDDGRTYISDELPSETISLSGNFDLSNSTSVAILKAFEAHFNVVVNGDGAGAYTVNDLDHDPIWMVLDYTTRGRVSGENIALKVVPILPTSFNKNANAEAIQDFSIDGQNAGQDELGNKGTMIYDIAG